MRRASVFISYAREDFEFANRLYDSLSIEFSPWMDKRNLFGGEDWERALTLAVKRCDFFVFCASTKSVSKRGAIQKEIKLVLEGWREKLQDDIYFIPLRIESCEMPGAISGFQWIDAFEEGWIENILRSFRAGILRAHATSEPFLYWSTNG